VPPTEIFELDLAPLEETSPESRCLLGFEIVIFCPKVMARALSSLR
jgi:hypothetical protein